MAFTVPSKILVLGAGELGTAVLEALSNHSLFDSSKTTITILLRQSTINSQIPSKKKELTHLASLGIHFLAGDITNDTDDILAEKFKQFHVIIGCLGMAAPAGTQLKLSRAVLAAGVKRYLPWQFGVDYDIIGRASSQNLFTEQLDVRDMLRGQNNTSWIIISTGIFMSFLFEDAFGVVTADKSTVTALGSWDNRVTVTDVRDIGLMVAEVVFAESELRDEVVFISGETISYGRLADLVALVSGKDVIREEWSVETLKGTLAKDPDDGMKKYRVVFAEGKGVAWDQEGTLNMRKGIHLQTVEEWLKLHLS